MCKNSILYDCLHFIGFVLFIISAVAIVVAFLLIVAFWIVAMAKYSVLVAVFVGAGLVVAVFVCGVHWFLR